MCIDMGMEVLHSILGFGKTSLHDSPSPVSKHAI
jgi:hypothetical protein